jgi:hypothetical protein
VKATAAEAERETEAAKAVAALQQIIDMVERNDEEEEERKRAVGIVVDTAALTEAVTSTATTTATSTPVEERRAAMEGISAQYNYTVQQNQERYSNKSRNGEIPQEEYPLGLTQGDWGQEDTAWCPGVSTPCSVLDYTTGGH